MQNFYLFDFVGTEDRVVDGRMLLEIEQFLLMMFEQYSKKFNRPINQNILLFWQGHESVVMGKFQHLWNECTPNQLEKMGVPIYRRRSGGGCVVHGAGNYCLSFIRPQRFVPKEEHRDLGLAALKSLGLDVEANERGDFLYQQKKCSGSAFQQKSQSSLHHFTLLLNADLSRLKKCLTIDPSVSSSKVKERKTQWTKIIGTQSKRSEVVNLGPIKNHQTPSALLKSYQRELDKIASVFYEELDHSSELIWASLFQFYKNTLKEELSEEDKNQYSNRLNSWCRWENLIADGPPLFLELSLNCLEGGKVFLEIERGIICRIKFADNTVYDVAQNNIKIFFDLHSADLLGLMSSILQEKTEQTWSAQVLKEFKDEVTIHLSELFNC